MSILRLTKELDVTTSDKALSMFSSRSPMSSARILPVSMTRGKTLAAIRMAMKSDAIGSKPVQP